MEGTEMVMRDALERIVQSEEATGEVRPGVALEFENQRLGPAFQPNLAAHKSVHAVVNLAAHHAVVNPKGHEPMLPKTARRTTTIPWPGFPWFAYNPPCTTMLLSSSIRRRIARNARRARSWRDTALPHCRHPNWTIASCPGGCGSCSTRPPRAGSSFTPLTT